MVTNFPIRSVDFADFPYLLKQINDPPKSLHMQGTYPLTQKYLAVVGSRKFSEYGKAACEELIKGLAGYSITIISGLALGMDSIAHRAALENDLPTVAVPGSGLSDKAIYPSSNRELRNEIVKQNGCVLSEFDDDFLATPYSFPQRNRIMAGLSHATLVIEAEIKSGTLITSKYATEYNRDVFTIPHEIFNKTGEGPHMLMRLGATPIRTSEDILQAFGLLEDANGTKDYSDCNEDEMTIINILSEEPTSRDEIIRQLEKPVHVTQTILSVMEIKGLIKEEMGEVRLQ